MIFILTESVMNGTVTISVNTTGVDAVDFQDAIAKVRASAKKQGLVLEHEYEKSDEFWTYSIPGNFSINGFLQNREMQILK